MAAIVLQPVPRWWKCPSCGLTDHTEKAEVHTQFHQCAALGGVAIPLVEVPSLDATPDARQLVVEREDYCGSPEVSPISAVRTERGDGSNDVTVFAPTAMGRSQA